MHVHRMGFGENEDYGFECTILGPCLAPKDCVGDEGLMQGDSLSPFIIHSGGGRFWQTDGIWLCIKDWCGVLALEM